LTAPAPAPTGIVIAVHRGGCEVVQDESVVELKLVGRHALAELELAVGDDVTFDRERGIVLERLPRRTRLARRRPRDDPRREHVIAANMDRLAIVASVKSPPFRSGAVDRFFLTARAGRLEVILVVNKIDLLKGDTLPKEIAAYESLLPVLAVSAKTGQGIEALRDRLRESRTVLAGHSGVGKSSLLNALEPNLRLEVGDLRRGQDKGRHTTARSTLLRLAGGAIVVDTPGVREIAMGPVAPGVIDEVFADVAELAEACRFSDCRHDREPDCAVCDAVESGVLARARLASFRRLRTEVDRG
jgi:ribosome biogenesis GTPase